MNSLLESLLSKSVVRNDNLRLEITKRPCPTTPREALDLLGVLGQEGNSEMLRRGLDLRDATPLNMSFAFLGRWPTPAELAALTGPPDGYQPWTHVRHLLLSEEFRAPFLRRVLEAYHERRRMLHVHIPRCAGAHVLKSLTGHHSLLPHQLTARDLNGLIREISPMLSRLRVGRTVAVSHTHVAPFLAGMPRGTPAEDPLGLAYRPAPYRNGDLLFAVIRPPAELLLSEVNAVLTDLRSTPRGPRAAAWAKTLGRLPARENIAAWRALGRQVLAQTVLRNPICTALADGTARGALDLCRTTPIQLVIQERYMKFVQSELGLDPDGAINMSEPILTPSVLTAPDKALIAERMSEDQVFWDKVAAFLARDPVSVIPGPKLEG